MNIGVVGFGHLGKAFVEGILYRSITERKNIFVCAKSQQTISEARMRYGIHADADINFVAEEADILFWIVDEKGFQETIATLNQNLLEEKLQISFMAGISIAEMRKKITVRCEIIRAMPNLAIATGNGILGYTKTECTLGIDIFQQLGYSIAMEEADIEKLTAFSACGLEFASYLLNGFVQAGIQMGFEKTVSEKITRTTFQNVLNRGDFSKGDVSEQGLAYLKQKEIAAIMTDTFQKVYEIVMTQKFK